MTVSTRQYRPTADDTPQPILLESLVGYVSRWVPVAEALPPEKKPVLVIVRGDGCPAFAWLKFAAGDRTCPYFVCPQIAGIENRGRDATKLDVTHWFSPTEDGLPFCYIVPYKDAPWGLSGCGWVEHEESFT